MSPRVLHAYGNHIQVVVDNQLAGEWGGWICAFDGPLWRTGQRLEGWLREGNNIQHYLLVGEHRWHQMHWELGTKNDILELDPGPLDAKVS